MRMQILWAGVTAFVLVVSSPAHSSRQCAKAQAAPPQLELRSFTVVVRKYDEALAWYRDTLGFAVIRDDKFGGDQRFILVGPSRNSTFGIVLERWEGGAGPAMTERYADRIGKEVNIVLHTDDLAASYTAMKSRGVVFTQPPVRRPWGGEALFQDLYGNRFVLIGPLQTKQ